ncbi:Serine/threonine-protein kinase STE11 [Leucoagaricus sp. SymC.cos]|nr:Serine/threonine-protein kinase STE11 [Leucoagaricus sp. SymC.cos]
MAPEILNSPKPTPESDIWSLGCTCYETLTGKWPFPDLEQTKDVIIALSKVPVIPSKVVMVKAVIEQSMQYPDRYHWIIHGSATPYFAPPLPIPTLIAVESEADQTYNDILLDAYHNPPYEHYELNGLYVCTLPTAPLTALSNSWKPIHPTHPKAEWTHPYLTMEGVTLLQHIIAGVLNQTYQQDELIRDALEERQRLLMITAERDNIPIMYSSSSSSSQSWYTTTTSPTTDATAYTNNEDSEMMEDKED